MSREERVVQIASEVLSQGGVATFQVSVVSGCFVATAGVSNTTTLVANVMLRIIY